MCCTSIGCQDTLSQHHLSHPFEILDMVTYGVQRESVSTPHCCTHPWRELF